MQVDNTSLTMHPHDTMLDLVLTQTSGGRHSTVAAN